MTDIDKNDRLRAKFIECDTCRSKSGSPPLCQGCIHNRSVISFLKNSYVTILKDVQGVLDNSMSTENDFMWSFRGDNND